MFEGFPPVGDKIVRKTQRTVARFFLVACAAALLAGCTDTKPREAGRKILDEVDIATRRYDRALSLLANPVFKAKGEFPPTPLAAEPGGAPPRYEKADIEIVHPETVNPKALDALKQAETGLAKVLAENEALAPKAEKALAHLILARLKSLKGYYFAAKANLARGRALGAIAQAEPTTTEVKTHVAMINYHKTVVGLSNQDIEQLIAKAEKDLVAWNAELKEVNTKLTAIKAEKQRLLAENQARMAEARKKRVASRLANGQKSLDLLNEALAIEEETNRAVSRVDIVEAETVSLNVARGDVVVRVASAKQRITVAQDILKGRKQNTGQDRDELEKIARSLAVVLKRLEEQAGMIGENCATAAAAEKQADEAYRQAREHLESSRSFPSAKAHEAMAEEADVLMSTGRLAAARLELHVRATRLVGRVKKLWPQAAPDRKAPQIVDRIAAYLAEPDNVRKDGEKDFRKAADLYKRAGANMERHLKWVYKGQEAGAYIALYYLTEDNMVLGQARKVLGDALQGREASPLLAAVRELEKIAKEEQKQP